MFTTVRPLAQLLSMPSNGARPLKFAPYPTLVGTAMTGLDTNPATTLGSAPSMPATTMITFARWMALQTPKQPVHAGHAHVGDSLHAIAHDLGGDGGLLGDRQVAGAGADHGDGAGPLGQGLALDGHTPCQLVMHGALEIAGAAGARGSGATRVTSTRCSRANSLAAIFTTWAGVLPAPKMTSGNPFRSAR